MATEHDTGAAANGQQECPECREAFVPYNSRKNVIFCSYRCQVAHNTKVRRAIRQETLKSLAHECPWCRTVFTPSRTCQGFCGDACRRASAEHRRRMKPTTRAEASSVVPRAEVACAVCETLFTPRGSSAKYCSRPCRQKGHSDRAKERHSANPEKERAYQTDYRRRNNESVRKHRLKHWYGITLEEYKALWESQAGRCAICDVPLSGGRDTHLDHAHDSSGKVRGILCASCNAGLGRFKDNPEFLRAAAEYLTKER